MPRIARAVVVVTMTAHALLARAFVLGRLAQMTIAAGRLGMTTRQWPGMIEHRRRPAVGAVAHGALSRPHADVHGPSSRAVVSHVTAGTLNFASIGGGRAGRAGLAGHAERAEREHAHEQHARTRAVSAAETRARLALVLPKAHARAFSGAAYLAREACGPQKYTSTDWGACCCAIAAARAPSRGDPCASACAAPSPRRAAPRRAVDRARSRAPRCSRRCGRWSCRCECRAARPDPWSRAERAARRTIRTNTDRGSARRNAPSAAATAARSRVGAQHQALEHAGKRRDADAGADEHGVTRLEDVRAGRAVGAVDVGHERARHAPDVSRFDTPPQGRGPVAERANVHVRRPLSGALLIVKGCHSCAAIAGMHGTGSRQRAGRSLVARRISSRVTPERSA